MSGGTVLSLKEVVSGGENQTQGAEGREHRPKSELYVFPTSKGCIWKLLAYSGRWFKLI